jgi:hypothetical protein
MTEEEAHVFLGLNEFDDIEDAHDYKLFEFKQYLLSKVPFAKTYESKIKQLNRTQEALDTVGYKLNHQNVEFILDFNKSPSDLAACLQDHQKIMSQWKLYVGQASSFESLKYLMGKILLAYRNYALNWLALAGEVDDHENVKASVEYDPVELIQSIKNTEGKLGQSELLLKETKRLFLWLKYNGYE